MLSPQTTRRRCSRIKQLVLVMVTNQPLHLQVLLPDRHLRLCNQRGISRKRLEVLLSEYCLVQLGTVSSALLIRLLVE